MPDPTELHIDFGLRGGETVAPILYESGFLSRASYKILSISPISSKCQ